MRKLLALFLVVSYSVSYAQTENHARCITDHIYEQQLKANPSLKMEMDKIDQLASQQPASGKKGTVRIIPVVFHVMHMYGTENISRAQIEDQMRVINEDFRRLNADKNKTRSIFLNDAADSEIEFRLATKDPSGACTDGIVRVYTPQTENCRDNIKAVSYWNSARYLNIWVVKSIDNFGQSGTVLGYAQFPGMGASTDGVVVRADYIGTIGTSSVSKAGRVLTHEIGHWLGLFHPFQSGCGSNCATTGDRVCDTPPVADASFGCPLSNNTCSNDNPNLPDQVENFMDYADGSCQNMFTKGQKARMDATLSSSRSLLWSTSNLTSTGTDNPPAVACAPKPDFYSNVTKICGGKNINFFDVSYNGEATSRTWTFEGGTPASSTTQNPVITYNSPGIYKVTLQVANSGGSNVLTKNALIEVVPAVAPFKPPFSEGAEKAGFPNNGWSTDPNGVWVRTGTVGYSGTSSVYAPINSATPTGEKRALVTPNIDFTGIPSGNLKLNFMVAYARRDATTNDALRVLVSTDCGLTWLTKYSKVGASLTSVSSFIPNFVPSQQSDWKLHTVDLASNANATNVLIKFESNSGAGNNIYIDDINMAGAALSTDQLNKTSLGFNIYPNPFTQTATISYDLPFDAEVAVSVTDITGRTIREIATEKQSSGSYKVSLSSSDFNAGMGAGVYFVKLTVNNQSMVEKLILMQ